MNAFNLSIHIFTVVKISFIIYLTIFQFYLCSYFKSINIDYITNICLSHSFLTDHFYFIFVPLWVVEDLTLWIIFSAILILHCYTPTAVFSTDAVMYSIVPEFISLLNIA